MKYADSNNRYQEWLFIPTIPKDGACYGNLKLASEDTYLGVAGDGNNQHLVVGTNKYDWEIIFEQTYIRISTTDRDSFVLDLDGGSLSLFSRNP